MNKLYVVGIGPGEADQMTKKAMDALRASDVIAGYGVYVDLVKPLFPEKEYLTTAMRKEADRCRMAIDAAMEGKTVSMISSGDAGVFGMAGLILELSRDKDLTVEVIPGVTAALSVPTSHVSCLEAGVDDCGSVISSRCSSQSSWTYSWEAL